MNMRRKRALAIAVLAVLIVIYIHGATEPFFRISAENTNNDKIDFSCSTDQDCVPKEAGCGGCYGTQKVCVNKNSVEGICLRVRADYGCLTCQMEPMRIEGPGSFCKCYNGLCGGFSSGSASTGPNRPTRVTPYINFLWFLFGTCY
jgi:hypothetical protein